VLSESERLLGWWTLMSNDIEFRNDGSREPMFGVQSCGYLIFTAEQRMMTCIEAVGRVMPRTDAEFVQAFRSTCAYSGLYRIEGDRWITTIDACWNPGWSGTIQERYFRINADHLYVTSTWYVSPLHGNREVRALIAWKRTAYPSAPGGSLEDTQRRGDAQR
jgi:hypothetical protein